MVAGRFTMPGVPHRTGAADQLMNAMVEVLKRALATYQQQEEIAVATKSEQRRRRPRRSLSAAREVHRILEERRQRSPEPPPGDTQEAAELQARVEDLQRQLGRLKGRLELTELTGSTMQAERDRLIADLDRERERADRLEAELRESQRSWWRRLFRG